jgi:hypothetical protein
MTEQSNPRARTVQDLMAHHLQPGMPRATVLRLLSLPYKEGVEYCLPQHIIMPDTVGVIRPARYRPKNRAHLPAATLHAPPHQCLLPPARAARYAHALSSIIEPNLLVVEYTGKGRVKSYRVEQH